MDDKNSEKLPKNPIEAQGMLIKAFYEMVGKETLPIIKDICTKQGRALGLKIRKKLPNNKLSTVAKAFSESFDPNQVKVIKISDDKFQIQDKMSLWPRKHIKGTMRSSNGNRS